MVACVVSALTTGRASDGKPLRIGCVWNAFGIQIACRPEITLTSEFPRFAPAATETFARTRFGLSTQTRRTLMSLEPKPTVTWPSMKLVSTPVISIIEEEDAGKAFTLKLTCGELLAG